ncbi:MAG: 50S ribosomal protein L33 [Bacilli bacterium]
MKRVLCCSQCGSRNYTVSRSDSSKDERLELKKFCKHCNAQTVHRETK